MAEAGARLAIRLLQDAAERGDLDPWDVDVIAVVDGFLDQLRARIEVPRLMAAARSSRQGGGQGGPNRRRRMELLLIRFLKFFGKAVPSEMY